MPNKLEYDFRRYQGLCTDCGREAAVRPSPRCRTCLAYQTAYHATDLERGGELYCKAKWEAQAAALLRLLSVPAACPDPADTTCTAVPYA